MFILWFNDIIYVNSEHSANYDWAKERKKRNGDYCSLSANGLVPITSVILLFTWEKLYKLKEAYIYISKLNVSGYSGTV